MSTVPTDLALKEKYPETRTFEKDAEALVSALILEDDLSMAAKILGFDFPYAWRLRRSSHFALARQRLCSNSKPEDIHPKMATMMEMREVAQAYKYDNPRIFADLYKELNAMAGHHSAQELKVTHNTPPRMVVNMQPPEEGDEVDEMPIEVEATDVPEEDDEDLIG